MSRIPDVAPRPLNPGLTPEEALIFRWRMLDYEIRQEFLTLARNVRRDFRDEKRKFDSPFWRGWVIDG